MEAVEQWSCLAGGRSETEIVLVVCRISFSRKKLGSRADASFRFEKGGRVKSSTWNPQRGALNVLKVEKRKGLFRGTYTHNSLKRAQLKSKVLGRGRVEPKKTKQRLSWAASKLPVNRRNGENRGPVFVDFFSKGRRGGVKEKVRGNQTLIKSTQQREMGRGTVIPAS